MIKGTRSISSNSTTELKSQSETVKDYVYRSNQVNDSLSNLDMIYIKYKDEEQLTDNLMIIWLFQGKLVLLYVE